MTNGSIVTIVPDAIVDLILVPAPIDGGARSDPGVSYRERYSGNGYDVDRDDYRSGEERRGRDVAQYIYRHANGTPYLRVTRTSAHTFPQFHWAKGQWAPGAPKGPKIPYRLPELLAAPPTEPVWICEGEKDADNLAALGLIATTNSEGAKAPWPTDELNKWFFGKQIIYILEDNDEPGRAHARKVADALRNVVPTIRIVSFPELDHKKDVSDWLANGGTKDKLLERAKAAEKAEAMPRLVWIDVSGWDGVPVPDQEWAVPDCIPLRQCVLFSGEGGAGKSILQLQLSVAHVIGGSWLGVVPEIGPSIFIDAEDDDRVLHRRLAAILEHYGSTFSEAAKGGLHLMSLAGQDAVLATASRNGRIETTALYKELLEAAGDIKPKMIGIASSANAYAGSELDRSQVQQFIGLLARLAITANGSVVLISHPSLTGINTDTGVSGTTQWHNAVRARFYIKGIKPEAGEQPDSDLREIVFKKNQYGPISASIVLRYQGGLFLPVEGVTLDQAEREAKAEEVFLDLLRRFTKENRAVSASVGRTYAPAAFAREPEARKAGITGTDLAAAMGRLFQTSKIWNEPHGKPSLARYRVAIKPRE